MHETCLYSFTVGENIKNNSNNKRACGGYTDTLSAADDQSSLYNVKSEMTGKKNGTACHCAGHFLDCHHEALQLQN